MNNVVDADGRPFHILQKGRSQITSRPPGKAVLGKTILNAVHEDMLETELPSWVNPAPAGFGTIANGKLSADQWRTVCSINLPITLIRLWSDDTQRKQAMLHNFIDLVTAVEVGSMLNTNDDLIQLYNTTMHRYLTNMKSLYPESTVKPNHHYALHLGDFLEAFGPVHSWRTFAFERYNYLLQQVNANGKIGVSFICFDLLKLKFYMTGDLELTMLNAICRGANIRSMLCDPEVAEILGELIEAYRANMNEDQRGTRIRDAITFSVYNEGEGVVGRQPKTVNLDAATYGSLLYLLNAEFGDATYVRELTKKSTGQISLSSQATKCHKVTISGVSYQPYELSSKNSNVLFQRTASSRPIAGRIREVYRHSRKMPSGQMAEETFLVVDQYAELSPSDAAHDHYRRYPLVGGRLYYDGVHPDTCLVRPSAILCHCAKTPTTSAFINHPLLHLLPLDRVRFKFT